MPIYWNDIKDKANYHLLLLIAFFLPLFEKALPPLIILFFISSLINRKTNLSSILKNKSLFIIVGFFCVGLLSLFYTYDVKSTLSNNETKLSLFIFPLALLISKIDINQHFRAIFKSFIEGCFVAITLCFLSAGITFYYESKIDSFFYADLSFFMHASYFSLYLNFAIALLYYFWFSPSKKDYIKPIYNFSLSTLFSFFILLLASKTGIFTLLFVHIIAAIYWFIQYKKLKQGLILVISLLVLVVLVLKYSPRVLERLKMMKVSIENYDGKPTTSSTIRLAVWEQSLELIKEKPILGYGTGDVSSVLTKQYQEKEFYLLAKKHLNSHNQFIQTLIGSGFIGLLYFLTLITLPLFKQFLPAQKLIYSLFFILIVFNFMTESMLERQSGVVFFSFFITLFYGINNKKESKILKV